MAWEAGTIDRSNLYRRRTLAASQADAGEPIIWAWILIGCFAGFCLLCIVVHADGVLRLLFPVLSFLVGLALFFRFPQMYLGFAYWMWFLTPVVARIVEMHIGWDQQKLMLAAPQVVTHITLFTFFRRFRWSLSARSGLLFLLVFAGIFYGLCVALPQNSTAGVGLSLIQW